MTLERELQAALDAARTAAHRILALYKDFVAIPDARADISTQADRDAQELILQHMHRLFPDDGLCAEEQTPTLATCRDRRADAAPLARTWVVDPIDGTRGFAQKNGEFSVM